MRAEFSFNTGYDYIVPCVKEGAINPAESVEQAQKKLKGNGKNTREFFRDEIFNPDDPLVVRVQPTSDGGQLSFAAAAWAWGDQDLVIFAAGRDCLTPVDDQGHVKTVTSDELSPGTRRDMIQHPIAVLLSSEKSFPGRDFAIYESNSRHVRGQMVEGEGLKNPSKTLAKVHRRVSSLNKEAFRPSKESWEFDHLREERRRVRRYLPRYFEKGKAEMQELLVENNVNMVLNKDRLGYQLSFPFGRDDILNPMNIDLIDATLMKHAQVYRKLFNKSAERYSDAVKAPLLRDTWRMKWRFNDKTEEDGRVTKGNFIMEISPQPYSGAGPIEIFENANLVRDASLDPLYPPESLKEVWTPVVNDARLRILRAGREHKPNNIIQKQRSKAYDIFSPNGRPKSTVAAGYAEVF